MKHLFFFLMISMLMSCAQGKWITNVERDHPPGLTQIKVKNITPDTITIRAGDFSKKIKPGKKFKRWVPYYVAVQIDGYGVYDRMYPRYQYDFTASLKLIEIMEKMEQEVKAALKKLSQLPNEFSKKERRKLLRKAAKPLINAARNNISDSDEPHYRYKTAKLSGKVKTPKGEGNIVAVYHPGNLKKSIRALTFRRSADVFVGPKIAKKSPYGNFGSGRRVDGYYAAFAEYGTKYAAGQAYMRRAVPVATAQVQKIIIEQSIKKLRQFAKRNKI